MIEIVECGRSTYMLEVTWKQISFRNFLTDYEVNNVGEVRNRRTGRILSQETDKDKYKRVTLTLYNKDSHHVPVHRLVAIAFIPNPENKPQVNHIDGDKQNNCVKNLEWVTVSENNLHKYATGLTTARYGEDNKLSIYTTKSIKRVCKLLEQKVDVATISKKTGIPKKYISDIKYGKRWKHISSNYKLPIYVHSKGYIEHIVELMAAGYDNDIIIEMEYLDPLPNKSTRIIFEKANKLLNTAPTTITIE